MKRKTLSLFLFFTISCLGLWHSAEAKSPILWNKEFSGTLLHFELLRNNGALHVVARDGKKKPEGVKKEDWPERRYLLDSSGKVIWEGNGKATALLADEPNFVILSATEGGITLEGIHPSGGSRWRYPLSGGLPISTFSSPSTNTLYLAVLPYEWMTNMQSPYAARLISLNMLTGNQNWSRELGTLQGNLANFGGDIELQNETLWWIGGRNALALDAATGNPLWQTPLPEDFEAGKGRRAFRAGVAFASNGHWVWAFSKAQGLVWQTELPKGSELQTMASTSAGLALVSNNKGKVYVQLLDPAQGKVIWEKSFKEKKNKFGAWQRGVGVFDDRIVLTAAGKIIGLRLSSGEVLYEQSGKKSEAFQLTESLIPKRDHVVMVGYEGAYAFSKDSGQPLWQQTGFIDPILEQRKIRQATLQLAFSFAYSSTAPGASKAWSDYRSGASSYSSAAMTATLAQYQHNAQMSQRAQQAASSWSQTLKKLESDLNLINRRLENRYASFYRHHGFRLVFIKSPEDADAVLVDLDSGQVVTEMDIQKSSSACVSQVLIDPVNRKVYQAFRQMALLCDDEHKLNAYQY